MYLRSLAALSVFLVGTSLAAEFSLGSVDPRHPEKLNAVILSGEIKSGDYARLLTFIRKDPYGFRARTIVLASPGGDLIEAIRIGRVVRATYQSVFVNPAIGRCASACFLIYVAAVSRNANVPSLGIHRPYFEPYNFAKLSLAQAEAKHKALLREVRAYLEANEVPQYLIEKMFALSSEQISLIDAT